MYSSFTEIYTLSLHDALPISVDTLRDLHQEYPGAELFFITGADALGQILSWKDVDKMWQLAHFVGVTRPGHRLNPEDLPTTDYSLHEIPAMAISSTDCRERVRAGKPVWYRSEERRVGKAGRERGCT